MRRLLVVSTSLAACLSLDAFACGERERPAPQLPSSTSQPQDEPPNRQTRPGEVIVTKKVPPKEPGSDSNANASIDSELRKEVPAEAPRCVIHRRGGPVQIARPEQPDSPIPEVIAL